MPQIVNLDCAVCRKRIESDMDAAFCPACCGPVHHACKQERDPSEGICGSCGGDLSHPVGVKQRKEREVADRDAALKAEKAKEEPKWRWGFPSLMAVGFGGGA